MKLPAWLTWRKDNEAPKVADYEFHYVKRQLIANHNLLAEVEESVQEGAMRPMMEAMRAIRGAAEEKSIALPKELKDIPDETLKKIFAWMEATHKHDFPAIIHDIVRDYKKDIDSQREYENICREGGEAATVPFWAAKVHADDKQNKPKTVPFGPSA